MHRTFLIALLAAISVVTPGAAWGAKAKKAKATNAPKSAKPAESVLNDAWYVMQAGSTPWGYFHEVIAKRENKYFYRYDMTKRENGKIYRENLGAVSRDDLTPVAFNLNKDGDEGVAQSFSGTYESMNETGVFTVRMKGSVEKTFKRHVSRNTIMEVFFPVWVHHHWDDIKKGFQGSLPIFTEDAEAAEYKVRTAVFEYAGERSINGRSCKELKISFDARKSVWCLNAQGGLETLVFGNNEITVRRVANEAQARSALSN